jgi:monoamine oxidase
MGQRVLVIGGGISGLVAALRLVRSGREVVVLEARSRLGGRIWTEFLPDGRPVELGAEFIHGDGVATWSYIQEAGLRTQEVPDRHWVPGPAGALVEQPGFWDKLEKVFAGFEAVREDKDFRNFLQEMQGVSEEERALAASYVEGFHAADLDRASVKALARSEQAAEEDEGQQQFWLTDGYSGLINWLKVELDRFGVRILLKHRVTRIEWRSGQVTARVNDELAFEADQALITLPVGVLQSEGAEGVVFEPALPEKRAAARKIANGCVAKVALHFGEQFWPEEIEGFIHDPRSEFLAFWPNGFAPFLTCWAGGEKARQLVALPPESALEKGIENVSRLFGIEIPALQRISSASPSASAAFHDWNHDPFSLGAYSYLPVGGLDAPSQLRESVDGTLFFAGEGTVDDGRSGTVHGAILSAERAVEEMLG